MKYKIEEAGKSFIYHWFVYMVGSLKQVDISSKIQVCFDRDDYTSYQIETFEILNDIIEVVPNDENFTLIPSIKPIDITNNSGRNHVDPDVYFFLRNLFLSRIGNFDTSEYGRIYIRRNKSHLCEGNREDNNVKRRQILNEDELVEDLEKLGFKAINFEDFTVSEKVKLFNDAKIVVSPQSGGLIFSLFANMKTKIIEIYPPNPHQYCDQYIDICRNLGISFERYIDVSKLDHYDNMVISSSDFVQYLTK
jgi:hypothetical protein